MNAGFHNVLFQYEPIAAAFAHERNLTSETLAAVIDIGGGTSDFSVIRLGGARMARPDRRDDILANTGVRIGGNDFDKQLSLKTFMPEFGMGTEYGIDKILPIPAAMFFDLSEWSQVNSIYTYKNMDLADMYLATAQCPEKYSRFAEVQKRQQGHRVLSTVEDTKIELTARPHISVPLDFLSRAPEIRATRNEFEMGIEPLTNKILDSVRECVKMSGVRPGDIGLVILTGGSTEIPYIRENFCRLFPNARISADDKLSSVGLGLAYDAMRR
ncbi:MAG: Hsp70 family protein, partial [Rickettsiales bacterium]|nr:Hsp70 family protein [Rickettsiales bacterium]